MTDLPDPGDGFRRLSGIAETFATYHGLAESHFHAAEELDRLGQPARAEAALIVCAVAAMAAATAEVLAERDLDAPTQGDLATAERLALATRAVTRALTHLTTLAEEAPRGHV